MIALWKNEIKNNESCKRLSQFDNDNNDNNNNNDDDNNNNNNNNNNNGLLADPLGGSSLLKYINYN